MLTTYGRTQQLNWRTGTSPAAVTTRYLALFTAIGTVAGTGFTETSYTGYSRLSGTWGSASGSDPDTITTTAAITFGTCTASPGAAIVGWGIYDASTGGNLLEFDYLWAGGSAGQGVYVPFTASAASPSVFTVPAHGFSAADTVIVTNEYGGTLPTLSAGSFSGLLNVTSPTTDTFTLTTSGSVALNASSTGSGMLRKVVAQSMVVNLTPSIPAGYLVLAAA